MADIFAKHLYKCFICGKNFAWKKSMTAHKREVHKATFGNWTEHRCDVCGYSFFNKPALERHVREVHGDGGANNLVSCPHCPRKFTRKESTRRHVRSKHLSHVGCEDLVVITPTPSLVSGSDNKKPKECDRCGNKYQSQKALNYHVRVKHPKPTGKLTGWWTLPRCRLCGGKTFSYESVLKRHMATVHHHGAADAAAKAKCHICNKVFSRPGTNIAK